MTFRKLATLHGGHVTHFMQIDGIEIRTWAGRIAFHGHS